MIIAKNDEEKRSRLWTATMIVSSVLIVLIAIYFLAKFFIVNPLTGKWNSDDGTISMDVKKNGKVLMEISEITDITSSVDEKVKVNVEMSYQLNKKEKIITFKDSARSYREAVRNVDKAYTVDEVRNAVSAYVTSFDYSVENQELTLTEREYGEQFIFTKE